MIASEYKKLVLEEYDKQLASQSLSSELLLPTPAKVKNKIVRFCEGGFTVHDEKILQSFIGHKADADAYRKAFSNGTADPFRPLVNFLDDRSIDTNQKNIDLLALLINFKPRPYHPSAMITHDSGVKNAINSSPIKEPISIGDTTSLQQPVKKNRNIVWLSVALLLIVCLTGYVVIQHQRPHYSGREGCMIWNADHYDAINCQEKLSGTIAYPIDRELMAHFRKITRPDTLTPHSLGKVWYAKYNGRVEFFTTNGFYPLDTNRRVLPMTDFILEKYVYHVTN